MSAWSDEIRRGLEQWLARIAAEARQQTASPAEQDRIVRAACARYEEWHPQPAGPHALEVARFLAELVRDWRARGWWRP